MKLKDATNSFGGVGTLVTVLLLLLVSAGAAFGCPGHSSKVVYRTYYGSEPVRTTVVNYGSPCTESAYIPKRVKYVAMQSNGYYANAPTYVAPRQIPRTRYVAVRSDGYNNYAPQYVAVRRAPAYVEMASKYELMRNNYVPRAKYVVVRDRDMNDYDYAPTQYVAVRSVPETRYVAVRNIDSDYGLRPVAYIPVPNRDDMRPIGYIPIRNSGCGCAVSNLENVETMSPRHVVLKSDFIDGTEEAVYQSPNYEDTAYVAVPSNTHVMYNVGSFHNNDVNVVPTTLTSGNVSYRSPAYQDSDFDDQAILDTSDVTYVTVNDVEDACLRPVAVTTVPMRAKGVRYVSADDVEKYDSVSYVPVKDEYMGAEVNYSPVENVTYMPVRHLRQISYVPSGNVDYADIAGTDACACQPVSQSSIITTNSDQVADTSAIVEDNDNDLAMNTSDTQSASDNGYRDGFEDGKQAALNGEKYRPANSSDFQDADNGYDVSFGNKDAYSDSYRHSYLRGYNAGFNSAK